MPLAALLALLLTPAQAQTHPVFLPEQDIAATYTLAAPGRPTQPYTLQYDAADERARITDPLRGLTFLVDLITGHAELIIPALHAVVEAPDISNLAAQVSSADGAKFLPLGPAHYAGLPCDKYEVFAPSWSANTCLTPQGVILHFAGHDSHGAATVTATSLTTTPQNPRDFNAPTDYSRIELPPGTLAQLLGQ